MADEERSYTNPQFEFKMGSADEFANSVAWNWDLAKRKVKKIINQHNADKEWKEKHPVKKDGLTNTHARSMFDDIED